MCKSQQWKESHKRDCVISEFNPCFFFVSSVVWLGWTRTSSVSHEVRRDPDTLSEAVAAALLPSWSGLQSRDWLHNCYHEWEVRPSIETNYSSHRAFIRPSLKRKTRSECHCSFNLLSAQVCSATCYQLWCYSWAEHTFLPHHIYPEFRFWSHQWPYEVSREVWIWREIPVSCYGSGPREGNLWHSSRFSCG